MREWYVAWMMLHLKGKEDTNMDDIGTDNRWKLQQVYQDGKPTACVYCGHSIPSKDRLDYADLYCFEGNHPIYWEEEDTMTHTDTIKCETVSQFFIAIQECIARGLRFKADMQTYTIYLTGGF